MGGHANEIEMVARPRGQNSGCRSLYGLTGRYDEARRYWQETQQVNPNFSVERLGQILPYRNPSQLGRLVDGLRNAGIAV